MLPGKPFQLSLRMNCKWAWQTLLGCLAMTEIGRGRQLCNMAAAWKNITNHRLKTLIWLSGRKEGPGKVREETQCSCFKGKVSSGPGKECGHAASIINCLSEARTLYSLSPQCTSWHSNSRIIEPAFFGEKPTWLWVQRKVKDTSLIF